MEGKIQEEATDLLARFEQKMDAPFEISEDFFLPVVSSLWTMVSGERVDPTNPDFLRLLHYFHIGFVDTGRNYVQPAITNVALMRVYEALGITQYEKVFKGFYDYVAPTFQRRKETLDKESESVDFIDRYLVDVFVRIILTTSGM